MDSLSKTFRRRLSLQRRLSLVLLLCLGYALALVGASALSPNRLTAAGLIIASSIVFARLAYLFYASIRRPLDELLCILGSMTWLRGTARPEPVAGDELQALVREAATVRSGMRAGERMVGQLERRYRHIFDCVADPIMIFDQQTYRFVDCNSSTTRVYGYTREEMRRMTPYDLHPPAEHGKVTDQIDIRNVDEPNTYTHITKDGRRIDVEILSDEVEYGGRPCWISIVRNITERKRVETELRKAMWAAETASRARSQFLANMSHEIRTPMSAVIGMASILEDTELTPEQRDCAETIRASGDALIKIINNILDFSKIESGRLMLEQTPFDLYACIDTTVALMAPLAHEKGLELVYQFQESAPHRLIGDPTKLGQVVLNLLGNAVKFTERGEIFVSVAGRPLGGGRHEVQISVHDTGIGIPRESMTELFKSFSQVDASTTRKYGGTGLGLAIGSRLSEAMGGMMWVESEVGKGSAFHFTIAAQAAEPPVPGASARDPRLDGKRLLIVDDNLTAGHALAGQAEAWGMLPSSTTAGDEALAWLAEGDRYDAALIDLDMPGRDGPRLAQEIRRLPAGRSLPLVLIGPLSRLIGSDAAAGVTGPDGELFAATLAKPVRRRALHETLLDLLGPIGSRPRPEAGGQRSAGPATDTQPLSRRLPLRILLAEDNELNCKVTLRMLERLGYAAEVAANGQQVLDVLEHREFDVILMDMQMPVMDGLETARRIRERYPHDRAPHVIALTANVSSESRECCLSNGMDDYMSKPVGLKTLRAALERCGQLRKLFRSAGQASPGSTVRWPLPVVARSSRRAPPGARDGV